VKRAIILFFSFLLILSCESEYKRRFKEAIKLSKSKKMEDWEKAIEKYNEVIEYKVMAKDNQALIYRKLGKRHFELEHYNDALYYYKKAAEILPNVAPIHYFIGVCYSQLSLSATNEDVKMELIKKAETEFKITLKLDPNFADAYYNLGIINFYAYNNYRKGIELMAEVLRINPQHIDAHFALGRFYYEMGEYLKSLEFYKALLSLLPPSDKRVEQVKENISQIYREIGR